MPGVAGSCVVARVASLPQMRPAPRPCPQPPETQQVDHQPDGARLLLTLESKRTDSLTPAAARLRELLPEGAVISERRDVAMLLESASGGKRG